MYTVYVDEYGEQSLTGKPLSPYRNKPRTSPQIYTFGALICKTTDIHRVESLHNNIISSLPRNTAKDDYIHWKK